MQIVAATSYLLSDDYTIATDKGKEDDYEAQLKMALSCIVKASFHIITYVKMNIMDKLHAIPHLLQGLACVKKVLGPDVQSLGGTCWRNMIAGLLFHKAGAVYYSLARMCYSVGRFGRGLKNCELAFKCIKTSSSLTAEGVIGEGRYFTFKSY